MNEFLFQTRAEFRAWLTENASSDEGVWLVFGKKGGPVTLKAGEALEEACQGTPTFPHLGDTYSPAGHWSSWRPQARGETLFSISFIRKLRPSIWMTWQWCSKRSRIAVARTSSPASMSGQSRIPLLEVITVLPRS